MQACERTWNGSLFYRFTWDIDFTLQMLRLIFFDLLLIVLNGIAVQATCSDDAFIITHVLPMLNTDDTDDQRGNAEDPKTSLYSATMG
jgi:hypothetical protein